MCVSTMPIRSGGTALYKLRHGVLINVSCRHKMSLLKSAGFSFLISNVGLGAHDGGALPLLTQGKRYSLQSTIRSRNIMQGQVRAHSYSCQTNPSTLQTQYNKRTQLPKYRMQPTHEHFPTLTPGLD